MWEDVGVEWGRAGKRHGRERHWLTWEKYSLCLAWLLLSFNHQVVFKGKMSPLIPDTSQVHVVNEGMINMMNLVCLWLVFNKLPFNNVNFRWHHASELLVIFTLTWKLCYIYTYIKIVLLELHWWWGKRATSYQVPFYMPRILCFVPFM